MDDKYWIYIVLGAIYLLSQLFKKREQPPEPKQSTPGPARRPTIQQPSQAEKPKPLTFEELLREITEEKQTKKAPPVPEPEEEYETFDRDLKDEARSLEEVNYDETENARVFKAYEDAQRQVFQRTSLEETIKLKDTVVSFERFKPFESERRQSQLDIYVNLLRSPAGLKQAVVVSEILKRKF